MTTRSTTTAVRGAPLGRRGLEEPVTPALARVLRRAVIDHASTGGRHHGPTLLHAGFPGGDQRIVELDPDWTLDEALRVDMVEAITRVHLAHNRVPLVWLSRTGTAATTDDDLLWAAAVRAAGTELGVALDMVVVTPRAWRDPRTGTGRSWKRHRNLPAPPT